MELWQRLVRRLILANVIPSAVRGTWWRIRGGQIGKDTWLPERTMATWPHQVVLGERCVLQPDVFFNVDHYWMPGPSIVVGNRVFIGRGTEFNIRGRIEIGDDCLIASGCTFVDADHGREPEAPMNLQEPVIRPIRLGRNVWIGARSVILKGVEIGDGAVIGAGSVVTRPVAAGAVVAGNPARMIGGEGPPPREV